MKTKIIMIFFLLALLACNKKNEEQVQKQPIDKNATAETVKLYNDLFQSMDKGVMLGHQDALAYGHNWYKEDGRSDVKDVTGDYPAVVGWELGHIEIDAPFNLDSVYFSDMKRYIKETNKRGGITTASWHGDNILTGNTAWDCAQDSVVSIILPGGTHHKQYLVWLDRLGDFFLDLKDDEGKPIPIVFRMYHEHTGAWFWWGSKQCTPDQYKQLWTMTVDYLQNNKGVHNLLYAYSPAAVTSESEYTERYPGDEYVDIVGFDCYASGNDSVAVENYKKIMDTNLQLVVDYAARTGKLPIVAETGMEGIPNATYFTEAVYPIIAKHKAAWVLFWRNAWEGDKKNHYYIPFKGHSSEADFKKFAEKNDVLLNKDIKVGSVQ